MPSFSPGAADGIDVVAQAGSRQAAARHTNRIRVRSNAWIRGATVVWSTPSARPAASVEPVRDTTGRKRKSLQSNISPPTDDRMPNGRALDLLFLGNRRLRE